MAKFDSVFRTQERKTQNPYPQKSVKWLHCSKLKDNQAQYCDEKNQEEIISLAWLIEADKGILQPLLVRKTDTDEYEIIAGHKRRRACKYLVEHGKKEYEFLPCLIQNVSAVRAEFQLYSSNGFHEKTDWEIMHELENMQRLLQEHPEEFPHLKTGRMVERLASQLHMKRSTVGEYLTISKNLGEKGMEAFKSGNLKKSAAVQLAALEETEQDKLLEAGMVSHKEIKAYKTQKAEKENSTVGFLQENIEKLENIQESISLKETDNKIHQQKTKVYDFLNHYMDWKLEGEITAMKLKCFSTVFSNGEKILVEEYSKTSSEDLDTYVQYFLIKENTEYPYDSRIQKEALVEYILGFI